MMYVNWQCPLFSSPRVTGTKRYTVPHLAFVEVVQREGDWAQVKYTDKNGVHDGYLETRFLEDYERNLPYNVVDLSDIETSETNDFAQYVNWKGQRQVNMCGEICAAFYFGVKLSDVLINWERSEPSFYQRVFAGGKARGTNADELVSLFELYGTEAKRIQAVKYTPTLFRDMAESHFLICSVKMNAITGELRKGTVLHWVVLKEVRLERKGMGYVTVFNPAQNSDEVYSWAEWVAAAGVPYGVMIEKHP